MSLVTLFWIVSWGVSSLALVILLGLMAWRGLTNRRLRAMGLERERYIGLLKARTEKADDPDLPADDVLTDLTVEILELVRGDEKASFAERVAKVGTAQRLHIRIRRGNTRTRILAAAALANFSDQPTQAALNHALDDRSPEVRLTAALSLAVDGHAPPPAEVVRRLGIGDHETSLLSVMLFAEMARTDLANVRGLLVDEGMAPTVRAAVAEALALSDDFAAVPDIAALAMEADPWASELPRYLAALAVMEHPAGACAVLHCLQSPAPLVRAAAARAAGRIVIERALDRLEILLGDRDWWVRFEAANALLRLGDEGVRKLHRTAERETEPARETAALILAEQAGR